MASSLGQLLVSALCLAVATHFKSIAWLWRKDGVTWCRIATPTISQATSYGCAYKAHILGGIAISSLFLGVVAIQVHRIREVWMAPESDPLVSRILIAAAMIASAVLLGAVFPFRAGTAAKNNDTTLKKWRDCWMIMHVVATIMLVQGLSMYFIFTVEASLRTREPAAIVVVRVLLWLLFAGAGLLMARGFIRGAKARAPAKAVDGSFMSEANGDAVNDPGTELGAAAADGKSVRETTGGSASSSAAELCAEAAYESGNSMSSGAVLDAQMSNSMSSSADLESGGAAAIVAGSGKADSNSVSSTTVGTLETLPATGASTSDRSGPITSAGSGTPSGTIRSVYRLIALSQYVLVASYGLFMATFLVSGL